MRYLFRGLMRETGRSVEGHVEAASPDEALKALSDNAIVTESITPDPKPLNLNEELPDSPELANALESAFDSSSSQVAFDDLTERYKGKKVWVIDRDKIRRRVAQVVDQSLTQSHARGESVLESRQRIQAAISGMFADNRNIASERNADTMHGEAMGLPTPQPYQAPPPAYQPPPPGAMEEAINRLTSVVAQAERVMASMALAARNLGRGGGGGSDRVRRRFRQDMDRAQNEVLLEIFKANIELAKSMNPQSAAAASNGGGAPTSPAS